jgi:DNA-binding transcriptional ArsR family regulator
MVNHAAEVDAVLHALADPTRRAIVEQLGYGAVSVSALAEPLPMSMPAVLQHLKVLTDVGLVSTEKVGRVRTCRLEVTTLTTVQDWIADRKRTWEARLDRLGDFLATDPDQPASPPPAPHPEEKA